MKFNYRIERLTIAAGLDERRIGGKLMKWWSLGVVFVARCLNEIRRYLHIYFETIEFMRIYVIPRIYSQTYTHLYFIQQPIVWTYFR